MKQKVGMKKLISSGLLILILIVSLLMLKVEWQARERLLDWYSSLLDYQNEETAFLTDRLSTTEARANRSAENYQLLALNHQGLKTDYQSLGIRYTELANMPPEIVYIDKLIEVPVEVRPFQSLEELKEWVNNYEQNLIFWGSVQFALVDCEDYVFSMIYWAVQDGFLMTSEFLRDHNHMVAATPIGNSMFYIEATPDGIKSHKEIWFGYYLDDPKLLSP